jgi:hypothetical protein
MRKADFILIFTLLACSNSNRLFLSKYELPELKEYIEGQLEIDIDTSTFRCSGDSLYLLIQLYENVSREPVETVTLVRQNGVMIDSFEFYLNGHKRLVIPFDCKTDTLIIQSQSFVRRFYYLSGIR